MLYRLFPNPSPLDIKSLMMGAIIKIILILVAVMTELGIPQYIIKSSSSNTPTVPAICLPLGSSCVKSKLPCCILSYHKNYLRLSKVPITCFEFGEGICQINSSIENFKEYGKLIKQRNETNFEELKTKYWNSTKSAYISHNLPTKNNCRNK